MKRIVLFYPTALVVLCSGQLPAQTSKAGWLTGTWKNRTALVYECWVQVNDTEMSGKSFALKNGDTVLLESISIISEKGKLYYIPTVNRQNKGLPVWFTATTVSERTLVFENPNHDFPQVISYTRIREDSLFAEISGIKNGIVRSVVFPMQRVQE